MDDGRSAGRRDVDATGDQDAGDLARRERARRSAGESLLVRYVNFVKLPHTLFALPFALLGVLAASRGSSRHARAIVGLVALAFSAARLVAMGFNRIADRELDARNPRTRNRELPRGGSRWARRGPR